MPTLDYLHKHTFFLHVYRSISLARTRRYTQLTYLFHQCATSLLSRDGRIADCTVRHPGVERPCSSSEIHEINRLYLQIRKSINLRTLGGCRVGQKKSLKQLSLTPANGTICASFKMYQRQLASLRGLTSCSLYIC